MTQTEKLELLIQARNEAKKALDEAQKQVDNLSGSGPKVAKAFDFKKLAEPLGVFVQGPLGLLIRSFKSFLTLGSLIPKMFLGPLGILIAAVVALEAKFGFVAKTISSISEILKSIVSFDFSGMGQRLSDIWTGAKEKAEAAKKAADEYFSASQGLLTAQGRTFQAAFNEEEKRHTDRMTFLNDEINKKGANTDEIQKLLNIERETYKQNMDNITAEQTKAIKDRTANADKARTDAIAKDKKATEDAAKNEKIAIQSMTDFGIKAAQGRMETSQQQERDIAEGKKVLWENEVALYQSVNDRKMEIWQAAYEQEQRDAQNTYQFIGALVDNLAGNIGAAFADAVLTSKTAGEAMKQAFNAFIASMLTMVSQLIAKFIILNILKALFSGGPVGSLAAFISNFASGQLSGMAMGGVSSNQESFGGSHRIPGPPGAPVPIIAHGQEIIGRPLPSQSGGGLTVYGDVYGFDGMIEKLRVGLYRHNQRTGLGVAVA